MASGYGGLPPSYDGSPPQQPGMYPPHGGQNRVVQHLPGQQQAYPPPQSGEKYVVQNHPGQPAMYPQHQQQGGHSGIVQQLPPQQGGGIPPQYQGGIAPLPCRLGLNAAFTVNHPEIIIMQEKWSWAGDRFHVRDSNGQEIVSMSAKVFSMSNRKEFFAPGSDELLFTLRRRLFEIPQSFYLESPSGQELLCIEGHFSFGTKFEVKFANALEGGQQVTLNVKGDWIDRNADITWNDQPVAMIRRQFANLRELSGRHTYGVEVAPGVDLTLISAIVVAIDEKNRPNN